MTGGKYGFSSQEPTLEERVWLLSAMKAVMSSLPEDKTISEWVGTNPNSQLHLTLIKSGIANLDVKRLMAEEVLYQHHSGRSMKSLDGDIEVYNKRLKAGENPMSQKMQETFKEFGSRIREFQERSAIRKVAFFVKTKEDYESRIPVAHSMFADLMALNGNGSREEALDLLQTEYIKHHAQQAEREFMIELGLIDDRLRVQADKGPNDRDKEGLVLAF